MALACAAYKPPRRWQRGAAVVATDPARRFARAARVLTLDAGGVPLRLYLHQPMGTDAWFEAAGAAQAPRAPLAAGAGESQDTALATVVEVPFDPLRAAALPPLLQLAFVDSECAPLLAVMERALDAPLDLLAAQLDAAVPDHAIFLSIELPHAPGVPLDAALVADSSTGARVLAETLTGWTAAPLPLPPAVALSVRLVHAVARVPPAALEPLVPGSLLRLPTVAGSGRRQPAVPVELIAATPRGERVLAHARLTWSAARLYLSEKPMLHSDPINAPVTHDAAPAALDDLTVEVRCELARLTLTVAQLRALAPGAVLDLQAPLAGLQATLLAGSTPVARGELVSWDDQIGLRITERLGAG